MLIGAGWRIAASHSGALTESVLIRCAAALPPARSSADPRGVRFIATAPRDPASIDACMPDASVRELMQKAAEEEPQLDHFALPHIQRFLDCHNGRPGVAVLAFEVSGEGGLE